MNRISIRVNTIFGGDLHSDELRRFKMLTDKSGTLIKVANITVELDSQPFLAESDGITLSVS